MEDRDEMKLGRAAGPHRGELPRGLVIVRENFASPCWGGKRETVGAKEGGSDCLVPLNSFLFFPSHLGHQLLRARLPNIHCAHCPTFHWKIYPEMAS